MVKGQFYPLVFLHLPFSPPLILWLKFLHAQLFTSSFSSYFLEFSNAVSISYLELMTSKIISQWQPLNMFLCCGKCFGLCHLHLEHLLLNTNLTVTLQVQNNFLQLTELNTSLSPWVQCFLSRKSILNLFLFLLLYGSFYIFPFVQTFSDFIVVYTGRGYLFYFLFGIWWTLSNRILNSEWCIFSISSKKFFFLFEFFLGDFYYPNIGSYISKHLILDFLSYCLFF